MYWIKKYTWHVGGQNEARGIGYILIKMKNGKKKKKKKIFTTLVDTKGRLHNLFFRVSYRRKSFFKWTKNLNGRRNFLDYPGHYSYEMEIELITVQDYHWDHTQKRKKGVRMTLIISKKGELSTCLSECSCICYNKGNIHKSCQGFGK